VTKQKGFDKFNLAAKWKRKYRGWAPDEGWFILTNPDSCPRRPLIKSALILKKCARDCKSGGYNLSGTQVSGSG